MKTRDTGDKLPYKQVQRDEILDLDIEISISVNACN